ncbi:hypothetical protein KR054_004346 [Drosophila jambulina]|nr:hypothetical protein KR054_004346 [Drosophila jambulina]
MPSSENKRITRAAAKAAAAGQGSGSGSGSNSNSGSGSSSGSGSGSGSGKGKGTGPGAGPGADHPQRSGPCPICLLPFEDPAMTECGHIFCFGCLNSLVSSSVTFPRCPLCRRNL